MINTLLVGEMMRTMTALMVLSMCLAPALQMLAPVSAVENISYDIYWFNDGSLSTDYDFESAGTDESYSL